MSQTSSSTSCDSSAPNNTAAPAVAPPGPAFRKLLKQTVADRYNLADGSG